MSISWDDLTWNVPSGWTHRYLAPSTSLIQELGWKTTEELVNKETKAVVFKSMAPKYLRCLFTCNYQLASHNLRNTPTDLKLPNTKIGVWTKCFSYREANLRNCLF